MAQVSSSFELFLRVAFALDTSTGDTLEIAAGNLLARMRAIAGERDCDPVIADAIRDRLEHAALTIDISGESYRGVKARPFASQTKDS